jgi:metallo-beta-lactamase family protein
MTNSAPVLGFLGGARTVTGSRYLIEQGTHAVLVDCGLFQGLKELRLRNWNPFGFHAADIDEVLLTHAHLDHSGYLPRLLTDGFAGRVLATEGTAALCRIVLPDSGHLLEEEAGFANRAGYSKHRPALPLYTEEDAYTALDRIVPVEFGAPHPLPGGGEVTFEPAGHILGSSVLRCRLGDGTRVTVSGDLGRPWHPVLCPPAPPGDADWILVESTYGDRRHDIEGAVSRLAEVITRTVARGGTVVIPAFAVDRTEVLLYHLHELAKTGAIPEVPVYVDSPMALAALEVYRQAIADDAVDIRAEVADLDADPFALPRLTELRTPDESKRVTAGDEPAVVIAASGMATGGRVLHHLVRRLPDAKNTVVLVGYQAVGTRARDLADGARELKLLGRYVAVRAEVVNLAAFSVHADSDELLAWLGAAEREPEGVFVVHGEEPASVALQHRIHDELGWAAIVPRPGERVRLDVR